MVELIQNATGIVAGITALVSAVGGLFGLKFWNIISGTRSDVRQLLDAQTSMNLAQQKEIETLKTSLEMVISFVEGKTRDEDFKRKIINIGDSVLVSYPQLHPDFVALLHEGTKAASVFFVELVHRLDRDPRLIESEAMQILKSLRANTTGSEFIDSGFRDAIRDKVGRPMVKKLVSQLRLLKEGNYNGKTREKYEGIVLSWVLEFLTEAVGC